MIKGFNPAKALFAMSVAGLIFGYGFVVGKYQVFPYSLIKAGKDATHLVLEEFGTITRTRPENYLFKARYEGNGVVQHNPELISPGLTLIAAMFPEGLQLRLIREDGTIVNKWPISLFNTWDNLDHIQPESERPKTDWNFGFNGIAALPDGSVVVNMKGFVKFDRCGEVKWKVPKWTHHSIEASPRGTFWTGGREYVLEKSLHRPVRPPYENDSALEISADGKVLREIPILDVLWKNEMLPLLFANNREFEPHPDYDIVHLNDVEEIPTEYLAGFPGFPPGSLLISIRDPNMLFVLDPGSGDVLWHQTGPWVQPHDADWRPDGTITVFDNNYDTTEDGSLHGGSNIISVNPNTGEVKYLYGARPDQHFYTRTKGDQQTLENGNILVAESTAGRVFEFTPSGEIAWEFINRYSEDEVLRISDATRYPHDYFEVQNWECD